MKINDVTQPSDKALFESLDMENDTGLKTEDIVKLVKSVNGPWSKPMTAEEFLAHIQNAVSHDDEIA
jgi:hypothetical protein